MEATATRNLTNANDVEIYVENGLSPRFSVILKWDVSER